MAMAGASCAVAGAVPGPERLEAKEKQAQICIMESLSSQPSGGVGDGLQQ